MDSPLTHHEIHVDPIEQDSLLPANLYLTKAEKQGSQPQRAHSPQNRRRSQRSLYPDPRPLRQCSARPTRSQRLALPTQHLRRHPRIPGSSLLRLLLRASALYHARRMLQRPRPPRCHPSPYPRHPRRLPARPLRSLRRNDAFRNYYHGYHRHARTKQRRGFR